MINERVEYSVALVTSCLSLAFSNTLLVASVLVWNRAIYYSHPVVGLVICQLSPFNSFSNSS